MKITDKDRLDFLNEDISSINRYFSIDGDTFGVLKISDAHEEDEEKLKFYGKTVIEAVDNAIMAMRGNKDA